MATSVKTTSPCQNGDGSTNVQLLPQDLQHRPPPQLPNVEEMQGLVAPGLSLSLPLIATSRMRENKWRRAQKAAPRLWGCRKGRRSALSVNVAQVPQVLPARQQKLDLSLLHMHHSPGLGVRHSCACSPVCRSCSYGSGPSTSATQC